MVFLCVHCKTYAWYRTHCNTVQTEQCRTQLDDLEIGLILQYVEFGTSPFGLEVSTSTVATRYYWNTWDLLWVKTVVLMRCFMRHDAREYLCYCYSWEQYIQRSCNMCVIPYLMDTWARKTQERKHYRGFTGEGYGKIVITGSPNVMHVLEWTFYLRGQGHPCMRCSWMHH